MKKKIFFLCRLKINHVSEVQHAFILGPIDSTVTSKNSDQYGMNNTTYILPVGSIMLSFNQAAVGLYDFHNFEQA
jgi:hypothetical protein